MTSSSYVCTRTVNLMALTTLRSLLLKNGKFEIAAGILLSKGK